MIFGEISHHMGCSPCYLVFLGSQYELLLLRICFYFLFFCGLGVGVFLMKSGLVHQLGKDYSSLQVLFAVI